MPWIELENLRLIFILSQSFVRQSNLCTHQWNLSYLSEVDFIEKDESKNIPLISQVLFVQMIERHLLLMVVEALIFMVIMATCITNQSRRKLPSQNELREIRHLINQMPESPPKEPRIRPRSSSSVTLSDMKHVEDVGIKSSGNYVGFVNCI